jgi:hypothetical protein
MAAIASDWRSWTPSIWWLGDVVPDGAGVRRGRVVCASLTGLPRARTAHADGAFPSVRLSDHGGVATLRERHPAEAGWCPCANRQWPSVTNVRTDRWSPVRPMAARGASPIVVEEPSQ